MATDSCDLLIVPVRQIGKFENLLLFHVVGLQLHTIHIAHETFDVHYLREYILEEMSSCRVGH
jgi:hypothetical protein